MDGQNTSRILSPRDFPSDVSKWMKQNATPKMAIKLSQVCKCFQYKNGFPFLDVINFLKESLFPHIPLLPEALDEKSQLKKPVIGLCDHFSVICIHSLEQNGYRFVNRWNGVHGKDLFVSFNEFKPQFGGDALNVFNTQPSFVVFDLIKIISIPVDNIKESKLWGFSIIKYDDYYPVLIQMDTFDGSKKVATPEFLMSILLKQHLKEIKKEIGGEKPAEVAFCFPHSRFNFEEKEKVQQGVKDACELLKIECEFIEV